MFTVGTGSVARSADADPAGVGIHHSENPWSKGRRVGLVLVCTESREDACLVAGVAGNILHMVAVANEATAADGSDGDIEQP